MKAQPRLLGTVPPRFNTATLRCRRLAAVQGIQQTLNRDFMAASCSLQSKRDDVVKQRDDDGAPIMPVGMDGFTPNWFCGELCHSPYFTKHDFSKCLKTL